jgi:hypothetical protein
MKHCVLLFCAALLLAGCGSQAPRTPLADGAGAVQTAPLPALPEPESLLGAECDRPPNEAMRADLPDELLATYHDKSCKLPALSPDGAYLAYVTLSQQGDQETDSGAYVDTVRLLRVGAGEDQVVRIAGRLSPVTHLEWVPTGQLTFQEKLWEGPQVVFIHDPAAGSLVNAMRLDYSSSLQWNPERTAAYAAHTGEYGSDQCVQELGGYDFEHGQRFPNFYTLYGIAEADDPLGIPYGATDSLRVEPFRWSKDGKRLWITVSRLTWIEDTGEYEVGPRQAALLDFSDDGAHLKTLAADPRFDYAFEGMPEPEIVAQPYQPYRCPSDED